ncbi:F-box associated interaction domain [Arabidopsis thaliana x Arabidopsis arenosa]|uniref:F-box associated interaction domain n=1 Tax=Arabidopsis thaliana x Arabidopsis arenosa TaxID=1240361 RepID=A0A8T2C4Y0_9BRAS|nr:F-box associated interaction domain [Arabidopsis thaliana x Arabidopsis arenosa]
MKGNDQENNKDDPKNGPSHIDSIPFDVMVDILTRLPVKSFLELQYVSKTWRSIIRSKDFINLLVSMSSTQSSRLLIAFKTGRLTDKNAENRMLFFTSSQEEYTEFSSLVANLDMTMASMDAYFYTRSMGSVNGFICLSHKGRFMICNPSTKQVITLPEIKITGTNWNSAYKYLGYDPVNQQYKAMRKKVSNFEDDQEHMVLTLGGDKTPSWRHIEGITQNYHPLTKGICINGFVYYGASTPRSNLSKIIVCFDVRSERLSFIKLPSMDGIYWYSTSTLINYKGKLANVNIVNSCDKYLVFDLWVLQDAKEHQWSMKTCSLRRDSLGNVPISFHGTNKVGDIIITPKCLPRGLGPFHILYYDVEKKEIRKVQLKGVGDDEDFRRRYGIANNNNDDHEVIQLFLEPRKVSIFIPGSIIVDASLLSIISGDSEPWDCKCDHNTGGNGALENQLEAEILGENNFVDMHVPPTKVVDGKTSQNLLFSHG